MPRTTLIKALAAVTATTTSDAFNIENATRITLFLTRANHSAGSSAFKVQVAHSIDGTFTDFNGLIQDSTNTNAQTKVRATTITLASDTTVIASMDLEHHNFRFARVVVTETTDGTHTATVLVEQRV
jgi:hypothetical protein